MQNEKSTRRKTAPVVHRRDATGHLDPTYAAGLRARSKESASSDDSGAFLKGDRSDPLATLLGETFVEGALGGEDELNGADEGLTEEAGGPFVVTTGKTEFAHGTDASNPRDAKREPFPRT